MTMPATTGRSLMSCAFSESVPVLKSSPSLSVTNQTGTTTGDPSGRTVASARNEQVSVGEQVLEAGGDLHDDLAEPAAGQALVRLDVLGPGLLDHVVRQRRWRLAGVPIPAGRR